MSKTSNITSLTELKRRQEELAAERVAARRGLTDTLAKTPEKAKDYALEDLALPALGVGLAIYVGYRVLRSDDKKKPRYVYALDENDVLLPRQPAPAVVQQARPAPAPAPVQRSVPPPPPPPRPAPPQQQQEDDDVEVPKSAIGFASVLGVIKVLVPAAKAIYDAVQDHKRKQQLT